MFGKKLDGDAEPEVIEDTEGGDAPAETPKSEVVPKPIAGAGLVDISAAKTPRREERPRPDRRGPPRPSKPAAGKPAPPRAAPGKRDDDRRQQQPPPPSPPPPPKPADAKPQHPEPPGAKPMRPGEIIKF